MRTRLAGAIVLWAAVLLSCGCAALRPPAAEPRISHYALTLEPDIQARAVRGVLDVWLESGAVGTLTLDASELTVGSVAEGGRALAFERDGARLRVVLPPGSTPGPRTLTLSYEGMPKRGIRFETEPPQVHTEFSTSQWMPCIDAPHVRATFALTLVLPPGMASTATGDPGVPHTLPDGRVATEWRLDQPMPSYLYGFAAGRFVEVEGRAGSVMLRMLATPLFSEAEVRRIFADTADMISFFESKSGVRYPAARHTQVLLKGRAAQEMSGVSALGERYGRGVLEDPTDLWLGAHELAHTWWGNGVTNRSWTHFWLNEGIATFMTAAYLEHRVGRETYDALIEASRAKFEALRVAGKDHALVFSDWSRPTADDRSIVYDKGAYVMHLLRQELGDAVFWPALAHYTRTHWGRSVDTADFRRAMEEASGRDLSPFFARWVLGF